MKRLFKISSFIIFILTLCSSVSAERYMQARIYFKDKAEMKKVLKLDLDRAYLKPGEYLDIISDSAEVEELRASGYQVEVIVNDLVQHYQKRLAKTLDMGGFHTYDETGLALDSLHIQYPQITTPKITIGYSLEGRPIWGMKISDNPEINEDEPEVFYNALIHAREPIGIEVLLFFMQHLLSKYGSDSLVTYLVNNRELWFVPIINPDGYEYNRIMAPYGGGMWRKNRRLNSGGSYGVDLNRNFGYMWGYDNIGSSYVQSSETYRGTGPFSEPETQAIRAFVDSSEFVLALNYHSYGNDFLYSWCYDELYTPDQQLFKAIGDSVNALTGFWSGTSWEVLYKTNGDADDWMYGEQTEKNKILAFTPEVGDEDDGFWPDPSRITPLCELMLEPNLLIATIAENPYMIFLPDPPVLADLDSVATDSFTLSWIHSDTLNPAVSYTLMELEDLNVESYDGESGTSGWYLGGFTLSTVKSYSPAHSLFSGSGDNLDNYAVTSDFVSIQSGDTLTFWCDYEIEQAYDYLYVEVSLDGKTFQSIPGNITTNDNPNEKNLGNGITGNSGGWVKGIFDLSQFEGRDILLAFYYKTDSSMTYSGFYADDIYPIAKFQKSSVLTDTISQKSYPVQRKCSGVYYYKLKAKDAQAQESLWSKRVRVAVGLDFIRGDANSDDKVSLSDIVFLINYLFKFGPTPEHPQSGDANYDGKVSLSDIVYLINYLFKSGPAPCID
jgi:hypothetical protein